jgi:hypothetical protein
VSANGVVAEPAAEAAEPAEPALVGGE